MMFEKLSENEKELMVEYINSYAGADGECPMSRLNIHDLPHILRFWESAKSDLFKAFGEELILTREFKYSPSRSQLEGAIDEALYGANRICGKFLAQWQDFVWSSYSPSRKWPPEVRSALLCLMHYDTLLDNIYHGESVKVPVKADKFIDINDGCKVIKVLGKIAKEFNLEGFEDFRLAHSMVLNKTKLSGTMCLSIHPLDYMTMSDNNQDWDSCMSWVNGGEYRQGTVEMMNSAYAVVAYMKSSSDWHPIDWGDMADRTWNSKKWRKMFVVHPNIILGVKDYPFVHEELSSFCLTWLKELVEASKVYGTYEPTMCKIRAGFQNVIGEKYVRFDFNHNFMYNDIYDLHDAYVSNDVVDGFSYDIEYSGASECMICGENISGQRCLLPTDTLTCANCGDYVRCCRCNTTIDKDNENYEYLNGEYYCYDCADNYIENCRGCYDRDDVDNMRNLVAKYGGRCECSEPFCDDCWNNKVPKYCGSIAYDTQRCYSYVEIENFTPDGFNLFDLDEDDYHEINEDWDVDTPEAV